jgi:hypothetical protein
MLSRYNVVRAPGDADRFLLALSFPCVGNKTSAADKHKMTSVAMNFRNARQTAKNLFHLMMYVLQAQNGNSNVAARLTTNHGRFASSVPFTDAA